MTTLKDRLKQGKDARKNCPRNSQASTGKTNRDPLPLIKASSEGRIKSLIELRYGRLRTEPAEAADNGALPGNTVLPNLTAVEEV